MLSTLFIGSHCVIGLLEAGFDIVAVVGDQTNVEKTKFLKEEAEMIGKSENLSFASGDLLKQGPYDEAFKGCTGVLHTAAVVELADFVKVKQDVVGPSEEGTQNVISSVKKNAVERFVMVSAVAAIISFNKLAQYVFKDTYWNEWSTVKNGDSYGYSKTEAERLIWSEESKIDTAATTVVLLNP
jgi:nucleoside-diphosphate-sugar epimerase